MAVIEACGLLVALITVIYYYLTRNFNYWKNLGIPYEKPYPLFGNFFDVICGRVSVGKQFEYLYHKHDAPHFGVFILDQPYLMIKDPDIIKRILIKDFHIFPNRNVASDENADPIFTTGLFAIPNEKWKTLRAKLSPMFTSGKMKMMFPLIQECGNSMQKYLLGNLDKNLEMKEICAKYTTDVITSCAFGINSNCFETENSEFRVVGRKMFEFNLKRFSNIFCFFFAHKLVTLLKLHFIDPQAASFLREAFWDTINKRETTKSQRNDLVDILIQLKNEKGDNEEFKFYGDSLLAQAVIFFTAGHETTSTTIGFTLYELCVYPEIQTRLRSEIQTVIKKHDGITYEAINEMKYLQMVVSETLRKYPVTPMLTRYALEKYTIPETGLTIDKGTPVVMSQYGLHSDPKYYPEPDKYDPERFNDENKTEIPSGAYVPFGDGPRNCIGERFGLLTTKLGIIYIIKDFLVEKNATTPIPMVLKTRATLTVSQVGIPMTIKKL